MANVFCITYGGRASNGNTYVPYKAIAHTADEAIAVINTWQTYGGRRDYASPIMVNATTEHKIRTLFRDGLGSNPSGQPRTCETMRTTGCGAWDISFYPALADTLEEHERIYNERRMVARGMRMAQAKAVKEIRLKKLNEQKRGWYHVELDLKLYVSANRGNDYFADTTLTGNIIASSGADAYDKAVAYIQGAPSEVVNYHGNVSSLHAWADITSSGYSFTFLGVKTDEGYSVEKWEEWKKNGEI